MLPLQPHLPYDAPQEYFDLYDAADMDLPYNPYIPEDMPDSAWTEFSALTAYSDCSAATMGISDLGSANVTYPDDKVKELRRAYYAAVSFMDAQVGRVLDAVEDNGLSESTVIMFVGDHGYQMGEHSEWLKNNNFEISHRAPMLLHVPGVIDQVGGDLY